MNRPISGVGGPTGLLLLLLSILVLTVVFDRGRYWIQWWRGRARRREHWQRSLAEGTPAVEQLLEDWELEMRFGEPLLQAAGVLGPLLGLTGTVFALMEVLAGLGPRLLLPAGASLQGYGTVLMSTGLGLVVSLIASTTLFANQGLRQWQLGQLRRRSRRPARPVEP